MGFMDKLKNRFQMGRSRQAEPGPATGDPYLETEGKRERVQGSAKQVGEQVKDTGKNARGAFKK